MSSAFFDEKFSGEGYPPPVDGKPKKIKQLGVRMDEKLLGLIYRAARKSSRTPSDWTRLVLAERARGEIQGELEPPREPDSEETATLLSLRQIEAADAALSSVLLSLGRRATVSPPLARALKDLDATIREGGPGGDAPPAQRDRPRARQ